MLDAILVPCEYPLAVTFGLDPNEVDPAIRVPGFAIPDAASLCDPEALHVGAFLRAAIPPVDPLYRFRKDLVRDLYYWWMSGETDMLCLWGPTGTGKTSLFVQWCARLGVPLFCGKGHRGFEPHEAFGHYVAGPGGETLWAPGPLTLAAQYGCPVLINEYDRIQACSLDHLQRCGGGQRLPATRQARCDGGAAAGIPLCDHQQHQPPGRPERQLRHRLLP